VPDKGSKFSSLFAAAQVICGLEGVSRDEAVKRLIELVAATADISDIGEVYRLVLEREKHGATMLGPGIAVPHARIDGLRGLHVAIASSRGGIVFHPELAPAHLIVLILTPADDPGGYLQAQAALARACAGHADVAGELCSLQSAEEVWRSFEDEGGRLPDYVSAGHMMSRDFVSLRDTDSLTKAIDEFYRAGVTEIPVVDRDGDLAGVVSENELLRVCLPEHVTWMEDLSPILHFEPFAAVLRKEGRTWLADIMSPDYVTLPEEAPAVQVAREMIRREVSRVFVTRGKKLVGVITIQDFLNKVLRD
jgi:PTS system nitrogen regulatory IIA component